MTRILKIDPSAPETFSLLREAVQALKEDKPVGMPTETVYGLAANCLKAEAASRIFEVKNRPIDNPLIVHISKMSMLEMVVKPEFLKAMPLRVEAVMKRFWPGPLTLLLPAHPSLPSCVTAGLPTVGVRFPAHPVAQALIEQAGFPLAAPSANLSGRPSPTSAKHVFDDLNGRIDWIVDGGSSGVGLESTVVDLLQEPPVILRPGGITQAMLSEVVPEITVYRQKKLRQVQAGEQAEVSVDGIDEERPSTPGMKYKHYAPNAQVLLFSLKSPSGNVVEDSRKLAPLIAEYLSTHASGKRIIKLDYCSKAENESNYETLVLSEDGSLPEIAQNLFWALREADELKADVIVAEAVCEEDEGLAIMNRLFKSAGEQIIYLQ